MHEHNNTPSLSTPSLPSLPSLPAHAHTRVTSAIATLPKLQARWQAPHAPDIAPPPASIQRTPWEVYIISKAVQPAIKRSVALQHRAQQRIRAWQTYTRTYRRCAPSLPSLPSSPSSPSLPSFLSLPLLGVVTASVVAASVSVASAGVAVIALAGGVGGGAGAGSTAMVSLVMSCTVRLGDELTADCLVHTLTGAELAGTHMPPVIAHALQVR